MRLTHWAIVPLLLSASGCDRLGGKQAATPPPPPSAVEEGRALLEKGQLDEAMARFQEIPGDADSLYYQGVIWAKRAETAPLPTPPPAPSPLPRGAEPPAAPEFKPEELTALELLEKAIAARPEHPRAHSAIAELLAPHAARRYESEETRKKTRPVRRGKETPPPATFESGPDFSVDRVIREYRAGWLADAKAAGPVERLIRFALRVGRSDEAEAGLRELTNREPEKPEPFIRYGDFLAKEKNDQLAAVEQYKQALVWRADDDATRGKIAGVYIAMGIEHWQSGQYALAESRFTEANRFVNDQNSVQGQTIREYLGKLREIRHR